MTGEARLNGVQEINRVGIYIDNLSKNMEARLTERINENNRYMQNLVLAMIMGIGSVTIAIAAVAR